MRYDDYIVECEGSLRFIPTRIRVLIQALVADSWRKNISKENTPLEFNWVENLKKNGDSQNLGTGFSNQSQGSSQKNSCGNDAFETKYVGTMGSTKTREQQFIQKLARRTKSCTEFSVKTQNLQRLPLPSLLSEYEAGTSNIANLDHTYQIRELSSSEETIIRPDLRLCNTTRFSHSWQKPSWLQFSVPFQTCMSSGPLELSQLSKSRNYRTAFSNSLPSCCEKSDSSFSRTKSDTLSSNVRCNRRSSLKRRFSRTSTSWPCALSKFFISYFLLISTAFVSTAAMEIQRKSLAAQVVSTTDESANHGPSQPSANQDSQSSSTNGSPSSHDATPRDRRSSGSLLDVVPPGAPNSGGGGRSSTECMLNKCNEWLHTASLFNRILVEQCVIFNNDLTCLIGIEKQCYLNLYYKGHRGWAEQKYEQLNCTQVLREAGKKGPLPNISKEPTGGISPNNLCYLDEQQHHISLKSTPVFCSLFGDPHLYTYGGRQQTCATVGAWPLVDNAFFTIQALNVPMEGGAASVPPQISATYSENTSKMMTTGAGFDPGGTAFSSSDSTVGGDRSSLSSSSFEGSSGDSSGSGGARTETELYKGPGNERVSTTLPSAITRVMIIFRARLNCVAKEKIYDTTEGFLPPSFNDGTSSGGHGDENLSVLQITNGSHVELTAAFLNTTIIIRRIGRYLSISVVSPVDVARSLPSYSHSNPSSNQQQDFHMELCSAGCPDVETLAEFPASPPRISGGLISYEQAKNLCRHLSEFFFDSCVFDVMVTGDANTFVEIGKRSKEDVYRLKSKRSTNQLDYLKYFPSGPKGGNRNGAAISSVTSTRAHFSQYLMWLLIFLTFLFQLKFSYKSS